MSSSITEQQGDRFLGLPFALPIKTLYFAICIYSFSAGLSFGFWITTQARCRKVSLCLQVAHLRFHVMCTTSLCWSSARNSLYTSAGQLETIFPVFCMLEWAFPVLWGSLPWRTASSPRLLYCLRLSLSRSSNKGKYFWSWILNKDKTFWRSKVVILLFSCSVLPASWIPLYQVRIIQAILRPIRYWNLELCSVKGASSVCSTLCRLPGEGVMPLS